MKIQLDPNQTGPLPRATKARWSELETKVRIVFNYAPIGKRIVPYFFPLDPCDVILQKASRWRFITVFDFPIAYHQSPVEESCRWLTAVVFPRGLRQYTVAPMGWKDSAEWLAHHLAEVFDDHADAGDHLLQESLAVFRDDGNLGSNTIPEHLVLLRRLLRCLQQHTGSLAPSKTYMLLNRAAVLGYLIGQGRIVPDTKKIQAVLDWKAPASQTELKSFVGFLGFFSHCVPTFSDTIEPLYDLYKAQYRKPVAFQEAWRNNPEYAQALRQ